jgi:acylglycerol lipase
LALETAQATEGFLDSSGSGSTRIAYRSWPHPNADITFAVVHGLGEHSGRYERFAHGMAKHNMATYALDLRGHGKSTGRRGHVDSWDQFVDDATAFVKHVETQVSGLGEVVPLGHSFGGVVMLSMALAGKLTHAKRFVLSSPALKLKANVPAWKTKLATVVSRVAPTLAMNNEVDARTVSRIPEVVEAYRTDPLVHGKISSRLYVEWQQAAAEDVQRAAQIKLPFLILAGTDDRLIDSTGSQQLHDATRKVSELRMLEGRYHEPFNDVGSEEVFSIIAQWLRNR